jgi:HEAT repeat protein
VTGTLDRRGPPLEIGFLREQSEIALDPEASISARAGAIDWLARLGGPEALAVLERIAAGTAEHGTLRGLAALAIGRFDDPEARAILERLAFELETGIRPADPALLVSVLEALSMQGSKDARASLRVLALSDSSEGRESAARALIETGDEEAVRWLRQAVEAGELPVEVALDALAAAPWSETASFFRDYIGDETLPVELRIEALDALADADEDADASAFVLDIAASSPDAEIRAAAYDALSLRFDSEDFASDAAGNLLSESDASVRTSLYGYLALHAQETGSTLAPPLVIDRVLSEARPEARVGAATLLAQLTRATGDPTYAQAFQIELVPWLVDAAREAPSSSMRRQSTDALALSGTPAAREALEGLSRSNDPDLAGLAERALSRSGLW